MRRFLVRLSTLGVVTLTTALWSAGTAFAVPTWTVENAPAPAGATETVLTATDCVTPKACLAVGSSTDASSMQGYIARLDGGDWIVESTPALPADHSVLSDVDCFNAKSCVAVGAYTGFAGGPERAFAMHAKGGGWQIQAMPSPGMPNGDTFLHAVSCPSATSCFAVGTYKGVNEAPVVERWNGSTWTVQQIPSHGQGWGGLFDIDCASTTSCVAVGVASSGDFAFPWAIAWNGTSWYDQVPNPPLYGGMFSVACFATDGCTAVGLQVNEVTGVISPSARRWNGFDWTPQPVPAIEGEAYPRDISCTRAKECLAVGLIEAPGSDTAFAMRWNGDTWAQETLPAVGAGESRLFGVSCANRASCVAVGLTENPVDTYNALVMRSS